MLLTVLRLSTLAVQ